MEGASYDIQFEFGIEALYCSELIYHADEERRLDVDLSDVANLGRKYLSPTGLFNGDNISRKLIFK